MARLKQGIFGPFTGKLGNMVGYERNGKNFVRSAPVFTKPPTIKQLACQQNFKIVTRFLAAVETFTRIGYGLEAVLNQSTAYKLALSYHIKNALKGAYPERDIDFSNVMLSRGKLELPQGLMVERTDQGLRFSWLPGIEHAYCGKRDQIMVLAYLPELSRSVYLLSGAFRMDGEQVLHLPLYMKNLPMECYVSFVSANRMNISDSLYLGSR